MNQREKVIKIVDILNSTSADDPKKGDIIFKTINDCYKEYSIIIIDFKGVELINTAFLNNAIGKIYSLKDRDDTEFKIANLSNDVVDLLREVIKTAKEKYIVSW